MCQRRLPNDRTLVLAGRKDRSNRVGRLVLVLVRWNLSGCKYNPSGNYCLMMKSLFHYRFICHRGLRPKATRIDLAIYTRMKDLRERKISAGTMSVFSLRRERTIFLC